MALKSQRPLKTSSKATNSDAPSLDHENFGIHPYTEYFKFSANGQKLYIRREFLERQELFWTYDADTYPFDGGRPISRRSYAAVKGPETCSVDLL